MKHRGLLRSRVLLGCLCAFVCEALYGISYLFTKEMTGRVDPFSLLAWRFVLAFLVYCLLVLLRVIRIDLRGKKLFPLFRVALFSPVLYFLFEALGVRATTASETSAFIASVPVLSMVFSSIFLKKKPRPFQTAGILITLTGVLVCVAAKGMTASFSLFGYLMLTVAVLAFCFYSICAEQAESYSSAEKTFVMLLTGAAAFSVLAVIRNMRMHQMGVFLRLPFTDTGFLIGIIYLGLGCSVLAFLLYNIAVSHAGTTRAASFVGVSTAVSITAGVLILHESFTGLQGVGTILILGGVYLANSDQLRRQDEGDKEAEE